MPIEEDDWSKSNGFIPVPTQVAHARCYPSAQVRPIISQFESNVEACMQSGIRGRIGSLHIHAEVMSQFTRALRFIPSLVFWSLTQVDSYQTLYPGAIVFSKRRLCKATGECVKETSLFVRVKFRHA